MTGGCCCTVSECESSGHEGLTDGVCGDGLSTHWEHTYHTWVWDRCPLCPLSRGDKCKRQYTRVRVRHLGSIGSFTVEVQVRPWRAIPATPQHPLYSCLLSTAWPERLWLPAFITTIFNIR